MKGLRTFRSQTEGLKYFVSLVISAANRGWFKTDEVKSLFQRELDGWGMGSAENIRRGEDSSPDHCIAEFWGLVCLPILSFFDGVSAGGDNSMSCDFRHDIKKSKDKSRGHNKPIIGSAAWYGQWTGGRFIRLVFGDDGSCKMFYDTGYRQEDCEDVPIGKSSFLNLPTEGDEDFAAMNREEFYTLAQN